MCSGSRTHLPTGIPGIRIRCLLLTRPWSVLVPRQCPVVSLSLSPGGRHAFLLDLEGGVSLFTSPDDKSTAFTPLGPRMTQGLRTTSNTTM